MKEDRRPAFVLDSVQDIAFEHCKAAKANGVPTFVIMNARGGGAHQCAGIADFRPIARLASKCRRNLTAKYRKRWEPIT